MSLLRDGTTFALNDKPSPSATKSAEHSHPAEGTVKECSILRKPKRHGQRKKSRKSNSVKETGDKSCTGSMDNLSCSACLAETVRDLSENVPYVPMNAPGKSARQDENSNDFDCRTHNLSHLSCASHKQSNPLTLANADDRSKYNLAVLNASKSKVSSTSIEDSPVLASRASPDEGIWSPSMGASRKIQLENKAPVSKLSRSPSGKFCKKVFNTKINNAQECPENSTTSNDVPYSNGLSGTPKLTLSTGGKQAVAVLLRGSRFQYDGAPCLGPSPPSSPCTNEPKLAPNDAGLGINCGFGGPQGRCMLGRQGRTRHRQRRPVTLAGHTNIAFIDEAANRDAVHSMSEEDQEEEHREEEGEEEEEEEEEEDLDEEEALAQGLFTPSKRTTTGESLQGDLQLTLVVS